jgi:hypothetical protein
VGLGDGVAAVRTVLRWVWRVVKLVAWGEEWFKTCPSCQTREGCRQARLCVGKLPELAVPASEAVTPLDPK